MKQILRKAAKIPVLAIYRLFILFNRVNKKIIIFESNLGRNYSGNPRFIYEEMVAEGLDQAYRCYFILEDVTAFLPGNAKKVKRLSMLYFYLFSMAGFWVTDTRIPTYIKKRKKTVYIQTWHGTPLKKLALDMQQVTMEGETDLDLYKRNFVKNTGTWDYLLSQNSYSTEIFRRAFDFRKEVLEIGYPRNDILFHKNNAGDIRIIKQKLGLPTDKKLILYAPTWRDNEHYGHLKYKFSSKMDYACLKEKLDPGYAVIVKAHYLVSEKLNLDEYRGFLYQFGASCDIAELYLAADLLITDYSSVMFDYSLLRRPMIFYAYDLDQYKDELRGFYFDFISEVPGPVVKTTEQLADVILKEDFDQYRKKYDAFTAKFNHADNGNAAAKVIELIRSLT